MSDSDADPGGSDDSDDSGFDKEAEREKLRKKFAKDEKKRESTRRMSELLLKGATMTNRHCDRCGSPIFRQNGQEFCPNCDTEGGEPPENATGADGPESTDTGPQSADAAGTGAPTDARSTPADATPFDRDRDDAARGAERDATDPDAGGRTAESGADDRVASDADARDREGRRSPPPRGTDLVGEGVPDRPTAERDPAPDRERSGRGTTAGAGAGDGTAAARDALLAAVTRHANAAATDDPRTAGDHLAAAREAAEALAALDRVGR